MQKTSEYHRHHQPGAWQLKQPPARMLTHIRLRKYNRCFASFALLFSAVSIPTSTSLMIPASMPAAINGCKSTVSGNPCTPISAKAECKTRAAVICARICRRRSSSRGSSMFLSNNHDDFRPRTCAALRNRRNDHINLSLSGCLSVCRYRTEKTTTSNTHTQTLQTGARQQQRCDH